MQDHLVLKKIIENRKSTFPKDYSDKQIAPEILDEILHSANYAPSHKKTRPWLLIPFQGDEKDHLGKTLAEIYRQTTQPATFLEKKYTDIQNKIAGADTIVAICISFSGIVPEWEEVAATAMAVQNMYLTCTVHKVGCYWSTPTMKDHLGPFLELDAHQKCFGLFYIGSLD